MSIEDEKFVALYVGRLHPDKNVELLIRAFHRLHATHRDTLLWIVGEGYLKGDLQALTTALSVEDATRFFGHVPNEGLTRFYERANVFVLPSTKETFGMVAVEAMYFAKPVIVPATLISAPDLVTPGENGFIIDARTEADLAEKLIYLKENPALCEKMGKKSAERAAQFNVQTAVDTLENCYADLLGEPRPSESETAPEPRRIRRRG